MVNTIYHIRSCRLGVAEIAKDPRHRSMSKRSLTTLRCHNELLYHLRTGPSFDAIPKSFMYDYRKTSLARLGYGRTFVETSVTLDI